MAEYLSKFKTKAKTLLVPYIVWNAIAILVFYRQSFGMSVQDIITGFWTMKNELFFYAEPWDGPLWFVRDLMVVIFCTPLISWLVRKTGIVFIVAMLIYWFIFTKGQLPGFSPVAFLWFSFGAYLAIKKPDFSVALTPRRMAVVSALCFIFFFLKVFGIGKGSTFIVNARQLGWVFSTMVAYFYIATVIASRARNMARWSKLASTGFMIFALHALIIGKVSGVMLHLVGKQNVGNGLTFLFYNLTIVITVLICYYASILVEKNLFLSQILCGNRDRKDPSIKVQSNLHSQKFDV